MRERVKKYYDGFSEEEWGRLLRDPVGELELITTKKFIKKYLPKRSICILDIGGGPGRYAFDMANSGHKVILADLSTGNIRKAQNLLKRQSKRIKSNIQEIAEADITNLKMWRDGAFDSTLCLGGVISHLLDKKDRVLAIKELKRVTKKGGYIFISIIGRLAVLKQEIYIKALEEIKDPNFMKVVTEEDYDGSLGFTACHFFLKDEFNGLLEENGLKVVEMVGLEGLNSFLKKESMAVYGDKKAWANILKAHEIYCTHPSVVDTSDHILAVCKNA